jgi:hypothetical protein
MKKATRPVGKKPAQKKPAAAKKTPSKPQRKAQGQSELTRTVARLDAIGEKLAHTAE